MLDRLKMEKISKEREGEWDWGERVAKAGCAVSRLLVWTKRGTLVLTTHFTRDCVVHTNWLWLNVEVMISDLNHSYRP